MYSDKTLIAKILAGNLAAYQQLIHQHKQVVTHMVARIISSEEDIKDVCQEVFIKVYQNLNRFNYQSKLSTWIAKIAYNTAVNHAKKNTRRMAENIDALEAEFANEVTPEHILHIKDEGEFIRYHISKLPLAYRTVLTLYHLNEFSYQEVEEITGMPEGTVKNYLFRARKLLKERLEKFYK